MAESVAEMMAGFGMEPATPVTNNQADQQTSMTRAALQADIDGSRVFDTEIARAICEEAIDAFRRFPPPELVEPTTRSLHEYGDNQKAFVITEDHGDPQGIRLLQTVIDELKGIPIHDIMFVLEPDKGGEAHTWRTSKFPATAIAVGWEIGRRVGIACHEGISTMSNRSVIDAAHTLLPDTCKRLGLQENPTRLPIDLAIFVARFHATSIYQINNKRGGEAEYRRLYDIQASYLAGRMGFNRGAFDAATVETQEILTQGIHGCPPKETNDTLGIHVLQEASDKVTAPQLQSILSAHPKKLTVFIAGTDHRKVIEQALQQPSSQS